MDGRTEEIREVGFNRRQFLLRTGSLGAAATVAMYPAIARAAGPLDPLIDDIAGPALKLLARDTISGLVAFQVPGGDRYSQAQDVTSDRPGGIDAEAQDLLLIDLDEFLPVPDSYAQALAASFTTAVSEIPIPADLLGPLAGLGEQFAAQMDDALRSLVQSDTGVPLSLVIALMLNFLATQVNPASVAGAIPTSPFASLGFDDKARAFEAFEGADAALLETLDSGAPEPLKESLSGFVKFASGALLEFGAYLSYVEWGVFDPATKSVSERPVGWNLSGYMPGRTTPADGWDEFKGYFEGRTSTETDPSLPDEAPQGQGGIGGGVVAGGGAAGGSSGAVARKKRRRKRRKRKRKAAS